MKRRLALAAAALLAIGAHAQAPAPKIAVTSLVGDQVYVTLYREVTATNLANASTALKMPGPLLDLAVLQTVQDAIAKERPGANVFPLKVPEAGSAADPARIYEQDEPVAANALVEALKQQGFTHLLTVTRHRHANIIRTSEGAITSGRGAIEGLGFYVDPLLRVQDLDTGELSEGVVAPYLYVKVRLLDLSTMQVRTQPITANSMAGSASNKAGADAWGALTPGQKMAALQALIREHVAAAVTSLLR